MSSFYTRKLQEIVEAYRKAGGAWPAKKIEIAEWTLRNQMWDMPPEGRLKLLADDLAHAMREEYMTDENGHRVRVKHSAKTVRDGEQGTFWGDIRTEGLDFMERAVKQRRNGVVSDCRQLKNDVDYYNSIHPEQPAIQLSLNFTRDVDELNAKPPTRQKKSSDQSSSTVRWQRLSRPPSVAPPSRN